MSSIAVPSVWHHIGVMTEKMAEAVRAALEDLPCSERALAREAGIPHSTLVRIRSGERGATPAVALALARALARWADRCGDAERTLRQALDDTDTKEATDE